MEYISPHIEFTKRIYTMNCSQVVTSIGLTLDILGAFLVVKDLWSPLKTSKYENEGSSFDTSAQTKRIDEQIRNYPYVRCGLLFLIAGFVVQLIAQIGLC
jgi:hypothetical protein